MIDDEAIKVALADWLVALPPEERATKATHIVKVFWDMYRELTPGRARARKRGR